MTKEKNNNKFKNNAKNSAETRMFLLQSSR